MVGSRGILRQQTRRSEYGKTESDTGMGQGGSQKSDLSQPLRGYHPRSLNSNGGWNVTSSLSFLNMPILQYSSEIRSAVLLVHGEKAHSRYFSETAYSKLTGDNKELLIIPGANHTDLYDQMDIILFE